MKLLKIALLTIIATLFSLPAAASDFDQNVEFEINSSGILDGMRAPTGFNVDSDSEIALLDADLIEWDVELTNAQHLCATQTCEATLRAVGGTGSETFDIQLSGSSALFTASIDAGDVADANDFFDDQLLSGAERVEFELELKVEKIDPDQQATLQVGGRYNGALIAEDDSVVPVFD